MFCSTVLLLQEESEVKYLIWVQAFFSASREMVELKMNENETRVSNLIALPKVLALFPHEERVIHLLFTIFQAS